VAIDDYVDGDDRPTGRDTKESMISSISVTSTTNAEEIVKALNGTETYLIPGEKEEDKEWKYKRWMPTMVLYDEIGLRLVPTCRSVGGKRIRGNCRIASCCMGL
jgi:hypothetical protein